MKKQNIMNAQYKRLTDIEKEHWKNALNWALEDILVNGYPNKSTGYDVIYKNSKLPPLGIINKAFDYLYDNNIETSVLKLYGGARDTNTFLQSFGLKVLQKVYLKDLIEQIEIWDSWKESYKRFVPLFIKEAATGKDWKEWNQDIFYEFFEKAREQCVASMQQGYFTNLEKEKIKENWSELAPLLKILAEDQHYPYFDTYNEIKDFIRKYTNQNRKAATNRLIASLQPQFLSTIVNEEMLKELYSYLNLITDDFQINYTGDWFQDSFKMLSRVQDASGIEDAYEIITIPWQLYELIKENEYSNLIPDMTTANSETFNLLKYKKQIILQGPPGTGKTKLAQEIAETLIKENSLENKTISVKVLNEDYIKANLTVGQKIKAKNDSTFEVVGIEKNVVLLKSDTSKPWRPSYNKIIESFNNKLWQIKGRTGGFKSYEDAIAKYFYEQHFEKMNSVDEKIYQEKDYLSLIQFHPSYTYEDFVRGIVAKPNEEVNGLIYEAENKTLAKFADLANTDTDNNYVLIVDEINRANLSSVLGELIYALEYRGKVVNSMYEVDGSTEIILPPNLYIIGTMNTADRSVGHIDYAIRRRFAFVDVLPENLTSELQDNFRLDKFKTVSELFVKDYNPAIKYNEDKALIKNSDYLTNDFDAKDVWLGHSYFIQQYEKDENGNNIEDNPIDFEFRIKYEIKPILEEYVKDGILKDSAKEIINSL